MTCTGPKGSAGNSVFINVTTTEDKSGNPQCSDGIDNNDNGKIDDMDPNCHERGDINGLYVPTHDSEEIVANPSDTIATTNSCALIDKNPLVFTEDEKSRLAVLLRKFYLISSTLRTEEDLTTLYNQIDQQKIFIQQTDKLTKQCYLQTNDELDYTNFCLRNKELCPVGEFLISANTAYKATNDTLLAKARLVRHGNPWFTKENEGTFPYTNTNNGYFKYDLLKENDGYKNISGYYYGTGMTPSGQPFDCASLNTFEGYGLYKQIDNNPAIYLGHYCTNPSFAPVSIPATLSVGIVNSLILGTISNMDKYCLGWEAISGGFPGDSIMSYYNPERQKLGVNKIDAVLPDKKILEAGCYWREGVEFDNTERLLNIW